MDQACSVHDENISIGVRADSQGNTVLRALCGDETWCTNSLWFLGPGRFSQLWAASFLSEALRYGIFQAAMGCPASMWVFMAVLRHKEGWA